jgi:protein tyrosine/serine phosphatase
VSVAGRTVGVPLCSNYSDVDNGVAVLRAASDDSPLVLAINMSDFATTYGIAAKSTIEEDPGYKWDYLIQAPVEIKITMKQEGGYRDHWLIHQLVGSVERSDYAHLSDEAFANFRVIDTTGMGAGKLYRSSSPINPAIGRSTYADKAARDAGIRTVINLADPSNVYETPDDSYYRSCQVTYLNLGMDPVAEDFKAGLAQGMRSIISGEAPYLIHCNEGKDRAGFVSAVLECLMGATADEVVDDYMETFFNYYGVEKGTEKYNAVVNSNIIPTLKTIFGVADIYTADLAAEAEAYLIENLGLSVEEVAELKVKLGA